MKLTEKDAEFLARLRALLDEKELHIELRQDGFRRFVLRQNYGDKICKHFGMDPLISISEGTLLICVKEGKAPVLLSALGRKGITAAAIGTVLAKDEGFWIIEEGKKTALEHPRVDPFWQAMKQAMDDNLR